MAGLLSELLALLLRGLLESGRRRMLRALLLSGIALVLLNVGLIALCALVVLALQDSERLFVLGGVCLGLLLGSWALVLLACRALLPLRR